MQDSNSTTDNSTSPPASYNNLNKQSTMTTGLCSGYGQYHSPNNKAQPQNYISVTMQLIESMVKNPPSVDKAQAQWFIPSTLMSRVHSEQKANGKFYALWCDLDQMANISFFDVHQFLKAILPPDTLTICYTTKSATKDNQKCRSIIPLAEPVNGLTFTILQTILNDKLEKTGIPPDRATQRAGQVCSLPNKGEVYDSNITGTKLFNHAEWQAEVEAHQEQLRLEALEHTARQQRAMQQVREWKDSKQVNPVEAYKEAYPVETALETYGYIKHGNKWLSPNSESGNAGVSVKNGKWYSHHSSDSDIGQKGFNGNGGTWGDAFDLFVYYECGGDYNDAVKKAGEMFTVHGKTINQYNKREHEYQLNHANNIIDATPSTQTQLNHQQSTNYVLHPDPEALRKKAQAILDAQNPCEDFDIEQLPNLWKYYIKSATKETSASPLMITQSLICTVSALIGRRIYIDIPDYFNRLYANIWCCSIAESGRFKSTALNKGALLAMQKDSLIAHEIKSLRQEYERAVQEKRKDDAAELEKHIATIAAESPMLSDKATAEGLFDELETGQGGMILSSELGGWLKRMNASHQGDIKEQLTDFYDVPAIRTVRTRTNGKRTVEEPYITINGVSTIEWIQRNLQEDDVTSGFFARFLLFYPPPNNNRPPALPINIDAQRLKNDAARIQKIITLIAFNKIQIQYSLSTEAKSLYEQYYHALWSVIEKEPLKIQKTLEPFLKRWTPYILKIAMIAQPFYNFDSEQIGTDALRFAKYIVDYAIKSTTHLFKNELGESEHQMKCRRILETIARKGGECSWYQLGSSKTLNGGTQEYEYILTSLEDTNKIIIDKNGQRKYWKINII